MAKIEPKKYSTNSKNGNFLIRWHCTIRTKLKQQFYTKTSTNLKTTQTSKLLYDVTIMEKPYHT